MDPQTNRSSPETAGAATQAAISTAGSLEASTVPTGPNSQRQENSGESASSRIDSEHVGRHGYPGPLQQQPLVNGPITSHAEEWINWPGTKDIILRILRTHLVNDFSISLVNRLPISHRRILSKPAISDQNLTCLVETKRDPGSNSWYIALKEVEEHFNINKIEELTVEIMDHEMFITPWAHGLDENEPIVALWPEMRSDVLDLLHGLEWSTVSVVRWGKSPQASENPITIQIGAPRGSEATWDSIITNIRKVVDRFPLDGIEITIISGAHPFS